MCVATARLDLERVEAPIRRARGGVGQDIVGVQIARDPLQRERQILTGLERLAAGLLRQARQRSHIRIGIRRRRVDGNLRSTRIERVQHHLLTARRTHEALEIRQSALAAARHIGREALADEHDGRETPVQLSHPRRDGSQTGHDDLRARGPHGSWRMSQVLLFEGRPRRVVTFAAAEPLDGRSRGFTFARKPDVRDVIERLHDDEQIARTNLRVDECRRGCANPFSARARADVELVEVKRDDTRT